MKLSSELLQLIDSLSLQDSSAVADCLESFANYLLAVNQKINLVSRRNTESVISDQIFDSLAMLPLINYKVGASLLDLGSGAGFPGMIHKIVRLDLRLISVDSNGRKIEFQRSAATKLGLQGCVFHVKRIEELPPQNVDYLIAKAVSDTIELARLGAVHIAKSGCLLLPRASGATAEDLTSLGLILESQREYAYSPAGRLSRMLAYRK